MAVIVVTWQPLLRQFTGGVVARDMQALSVHAMASPNSTQELYGRVLCGQEPNSYWI